MSVYFIRPIGMAGPVKIGMSRAPDRRRDTLATWAPFPLEIAAVVDGNLETERRFHALFADSHTHCEWFTWSPQMELVIQSIVAGSFDPSSLPEPRRLPRKEGVSRRKKWTENERLGASYRHRMLHVEKRLGLHFWCQPNPCIIEGMIGRGEATAETFALADDMIANPHGYCITEAEYRARFPRAYPARAAA